MSYFKHDKRFNIPSTLFAIIILASFGAGWFLNGSFVQDRIPPELSGTGRDKPEEVDFGVFWEAWRELEKSYVKRGELDTQKMIYGAVSGLVESLDDPYSVFLPPQDKKRFLEDVSGSFEGVGIEIGFRKGILTVISPLEGTPARQVGIRPGDKILKVDGELTVDYTLDEAVDKIRGPKGSDVVLTILRNGDEKTRDFIITRGTIDVPVLELRFIGGGEDKIAHLKLFQFSENAARKFGASAEEILLSDAKGIILDLRNNPGGYLEVSRDIAGWFFETGDLVAIEDFGDPENREEYRSPGPAKLKNYPLAVLVNGGSASASEILAGALRDNANVKLVGEKTFGKGTVQELKNISGGSSIKLTVARWLTPNGFSIHEAGLSPDVPVEIDESEQDSVQDPQLEKAVEVLRGI